MKEKLPRKGNKTPIKVNKNVFIDSDNKKDKVVAERVETESDSIFLPFSKILFQRDKP